MKYVAYLRISKDSHEMGRSRSQNLGIDAQRQIITHFYPNIEKEFTETKSAKNITERPVLQEAIQYCINNRAILVVAKLDRLSRNVDDVRAIVKQLNKKVIFCDIPTQGDGTDMFMITIYAAFAEREREMISLRTSQALQQKIKREGSWQKGNASFGSKENIEKAKAALKKKTAENENIIRAAAMIRQLLTQSKSMPEIITHLNANGFRTSQGNKFSKPIQVQRIVAQA